MSPVRGDISVARRVSAGLCQSKISIAPEGRHISYLNDMSPLRGFTSFLIVIPSTDLAGLLILRPLRGCGLGASYAYVELTWFNKLLCIEAATERLCVLFLCAIVLLQGLLVCRDASRKRGCIHLFAG